LEWKRGNYIALERNPRYWQPSRPNLDNVVFRILPDAASSVNALETDDVQLLFAPPLADLERLRRTPGLALNARRGGIAAALTAFEFNLDRPQFKDVRVRRAFAHAIDRNFLRKNVYFGFGAVADSTLAQDVPAFRAANLPAYPFDLDKAAWLLDQAGFRRGPRGIRLSITHDPAPTSPALFQTAQYLRGNLAKIGVDIQIRTRDFANFVRQVYTARDFDTTQYSATSGPDPAIGTQRFYWSQNFQRGVAFSNASHYADPEVDRLLEAAQRELDPARRTSLYADFQRKVQADLPRIPLIFFNQPVVSSARLRDFWTGAYGILENFADAWLAAA
jgi:peptide/nickel transport system substrate-binding protein